MIDWWNSLNTLGQILACIAIPSTLIMFVQIIMMILGLSHDAADDFDVSGLDVDGDGIPDDMTSFASDGIYGSDVADSYESDIHTDSGFKLLSFRSIISFLAMFGWSGLVMQKEGTSVPVTLAVAFAVGFVVMLIVAAVFMWLLKLTNDGTTNINNALGVSGTVYLRIPSERKGCGKVNVIVQEALREFNAVTDEQTDIQFGEEIITVGISGQNTLIVKRK